MSGEGTRVILVSVFTASLIVANITASKIIQLWWLTFPAGTLAYCITFLCTDLYTEFFGKRETELVVLAGFVANILMVVLVQAAVMAPIAPFQEGYQEIYANVLAPTWRIVLASMVAYIISQSHDVWAFHFWGKLTRGKHLWIRNNASTMVSQAIDTLIFTFIAFWGAIDLVSILNMMVTLYVIKWVIAALDTPFCYLGVHLIRKITNLKPIWLRGDEV
ncbi:MAG: queuosine precursor transporter [Candidatus Nezhaarchaeota archaeon]|nr:queuosine precursor transporter [Candidatus Nezhaarchaeota archaeon]